MKKLIVFGVIVLFLGVAIAPSINANIFRTSLESTPEIIVDEYENHYCLVAGSSSETYRAIKILIGDSNFFSIVHGAWDNLGGGLYPASGWIYTEGGNGKWSYDGKFIGNLDYIITPGFNEHYVGVKGFFGIFLGSFYIGFAKSVGIETKE